MVKARYHPYNKPKGQYTYVTVTCLRCGDFFESWDKTKNRRCEKCAVVVSVKPTVTHDMVYCVDYGDMADVIQRRKHKKKVS